jgi:uncharacterized protein YyaL (SSP411 family)
LAGISDTVSIAQTYGVSESHVSRTVRKVEDILMKSGQLTLPGKKVLQSRDWVIEVVLVDAAEQPVERPQKKRRHYSGKKKRHTQKAQLMVNLNAKQILATAFAQGSTHDFQLFKQSQVG